MISAYGEKLSLKAVFSQRQPLIPLLLAGIWLEMISTGKSVQKWETSLRVGY
jgi:hypothetical protein